MEHIALGAIDDLSSVWLSRWIGRHDVFWLEVSMGKTQVFLAPAGRLGGCTREARG